MHSLPLRALALALLALPAAACGPGPGGPSRTAGPPVGPVPSWTLSPAATALDQADTERAARVARDWPGSENERLWNSTYLPYQVPAVWLPPGGLRSGPDQSAYQSGRVDLRAVLPFSPATGRSAGRTAALSRCR